MNTPSNPAERVAAFLAEHDGLFGKAAQVISAVGSGRAAPVTLTKGDLRELLTENQAQKFTVDEVLALLPPHERAFVSPEAVAVVLRVCTAGW